MKSVRFLKHEFIKESTTGEKANIEIFSIAEYKGAQVALWILYESVQFDCRLSALQPPPPNVVYLPRLTKISEPFCDVLGSARSKIHNRKLNTAYNITVLQ